VDQTSSSLRTRVASNATLDPPTRHHSIPTFTDGPWSWSAQFAPPHAACGRHASAHRSDRSPRVGHCRISAHRVIFPSCTVVHPALGTVGRWLCRDEFLMTHVIAVDEPTLRPGTIAGKLDAMGHALDAAHGVTTLLGCPNVRRTLIVI